MGRVGHVINQIDMCKGDDDFRFKLFAKHLERAEWTFFFHGKPAARRGRSTLGFEG